MAERTGSEHAQIAIAVAAERTGLSVSIVRRCIRLQLVGQTLTEAELARLRRIRRLKELGVNLAGIEIILRMRRQIKDLQVQLERLES
jgi:pyruvate/2-oxoglutarate dehydrogenase complex dihydrolipoamide acyltransferase (E2) component